MIEKQIPVITFDFDFSIGEKPAFTLLRDENRKHDSFQYFIVSGTLRNNSNKTISTCCLNLIKLINDNNRVAAEQKKWFDQGYKLTNKIEPKQEECCEAEISVPDVFPRIENHKGLDIIFCQKPPGSFCDFLLDFSCLDEGGNLHHTLYILTNHYKKNGSDEHCRKAEYCGCIVGDIDDNSIQNINNILKTITDNKR